MASFNMKNLLLCTSNR